MKNVFLAFALLIGGSAVAQSTGVGVGLNWSTPGLSVHQYFDDYNSAQLFVGGTYAEQLGTTSSVLYATGRYLYHFDSRSDFVPYAYGALSYMRSETDGGWIDISMTMYGIGGGAGIEWKNYDENFGVMIDLGPTAVYDNNNFILGLSIMFGVHYYIEN